MSTHWAGVTPGKEEMTSAHSLPCLSFLEPSPALCKGRHSEHLISCILIITQTLSSSLQKERKTPSPPPDSSQHTCLSISIPAQSSPASTQCPCPYHRKATSALGHWSTMSIYVSKVIKTCFYHTQQCILSIFFNL